MRKSYEKSFHNALSDFQRLEHEKFTGKLSLKRLPATRMKAKRNHVLPLCDEWQMQIVTAIKTWRRDGSDLVFPSVRAQLSDVAVTKMLHSIAPNVTVHG